MSSYKFSQDFSLTDYMLADHDALHALDDIEAAFDWGAIEQRLSKVYNKSYGRPSYPLLQLFRILLLDYLHKIGSDVQLEKMLARDLLFRKFCGIGLDQRPPSHDTISRFRRELAAINLWEELLEEVNNQLSANHLLIQEGQVSIMDATVIEAHQIKGSTKDAEADWSVKNNSRGKKTSTYGYKIHSNCDEDGFILKQTVTAGNEYDGNQRDALFTGKETQLYADSVYDSTAKRTDLDKRVVDNRVQRKGCRHKPLTDEDHAWNKEVGVTRARIEHQFAGYKERFGIKRTRFIGLDMNTTYAGLAAIAHNIKKGALFFARFGLRQESCA
jgi:IS5 family transposase